MLEISPFPTIIQLKGFLGGIHYYVTSFLLFWTGIRVPIACSLLGGGVTTQKSGYRDTRICSYIVSVCYRSTSCFQSCPGISYYTSSSPHLFSSPSDSSAALFFAPYRKSPSCYHRRQDTQAPVLQRDQSQRSRIDFIAIYCATVFCLLVM